MFKMLETEWKIDKEISIYRNLLKLKGISHNSANKLCTLLGISCNTPFKNLSTHKVDQLFLLLSYYKKRTAPFKWKNIQDIKGSSSPQLDLALLGDIYHNPILSNLNDYVKNNRITLININSYRGRRSKHGYPVHGQRTRSNANTAKRSNRIKV